MNLDNIIIKPIVSEKASKTSEKRNVYCFKVNLNANKYQVTNAIQKFYNVQVVSCNTSILPGKVKRTSKGVTKIIKMEKAFVEVSKDQTIKLFEGI